MTFSKFSNIYNDYQESGLSIKEYCNMMSYHKSSFYDWLKKYPDVVNNYQRANVLTAPLSSTARLSPLIILDQESRSSKEEITSNYPLNLSSSTSNVSKEIGSATNKATIAQRIEITHPSGLSIKLSGSLDTQLLECILKHL